MEHSSNNNRRYIESARKREKSRMIHQIRIDEEKRDRFSPENDENFSFPYTDIDCIQFNTFDTGVNAKATKA